MAPDERSLAPVPVPAGEPHERFAEYRQRRGMRNTTQRQLLLDHIFRHHQHFDAEQLIAQLPARGQPGHVSRPTVYRTLAEFVDAGLLRKFELDGRAVYEHAYGYPQHDHLYCTQCSRLIEFDSRELVALRNRVAGEHGFHVAGHRLLIHGLCAACAKHRKTRGASR